ncbi:MAG: hemolysin III family protein [Bacilli bacterium]|jgi:hemolysin III
MALTKRQSLGEEIANAVSHGLGAVFGIVVLVLMLVKSHAVEQVVSVTIFGTGIILLYLMSTLYHAFKNDSVVKELFKRFDHLSVYLLIGSTYSPIYILILDKPLGWILLAVQWAIIIVGIVLKATLIKRFMYFHLAMYLILGWSGIIFFGSLYAFSSIAFFLILGGGIAYTVGVLFYALHPFKYSHFVWHIFVFIGTLLHFLAIYLFLLV